MKLGVQFYTIREFCKTTEELAESIAKVANIGYTTVQFAGICDYEPEWMASQLKKNGLECVIAHTKSDKLINTPEVVCREHNTFGCRNISLGMLPKGDFSPEAYARYISTVLPAARAVREYGCKCFYHNHYHEFWRRDDGQLIFEQILEDFPEDTVGFVFDTYWAQFAGADPAEWIERLGRRVEFIHLKDMSITAKEQRMAPVGGGNMNFKAILRAADKAGAEYLLVEQDNCYGEDPFDCLRRSYDYLSSFGLK